MPPKPRQPRRALPVVGEQAMHIGADHPAVGGHRAVGRTVGEPRKWPRAIRPGRYPHMHLIAGKWRTVARGAARGFEALVGRQRRRDIEQAETFDRRGGGSFNAVGIGDRAAKHLIAAAKAENHAAAAPMRGDVDIESGRTQGREIGDGGLRAGQHDEIGIAGQRRARTNAHELDVAFRVERIEIVEIGDVRQDRDSDAHARVRLRRRTLLERQRILRRQQARIGKIRHQAERLPSGGLRDVLHAGSKQRRHRRGIC